MKDIARDLGVSVVTVSKVLRNHQDISSETRQRVLQRMKELDYRPNLAARSLATGKSYMMGLVVPDLVHPFFSQLAKGVSRVLRKKGYSLIISSSEEDVTLEEQEIEQMLARSLDLLIIASAQRSPAPFLRIEQHKKPYILLDRKLDGLAANFVGTDDHAVGQIATEHLIDNGCRLIAYIGARHTSPASDRFEGYHQTLAARGITVPEQYVGFAEHGDDLGDVTGYQIMKGILELRPRPDGVFCYNDPTAMGAMKAILDTGLSIPQDVAIVGCGNSNYTSVLRVPLSSIDQSSELMGERAAQLAFKLLSGGAEKSRPKTILMEPKLVVRESSVRPRS